MTDLQMCKNPLQNSQKRGADVSDLAYVDEARNWAEFLIRKEFKGPGDTIDAAMSRTARRHKIASAQLWGLRYRPPKDMAVSLYMRLRDAFRRESENLDRRLAHEIAIAESLGTDATNSKAYRVAVAALAEQAARK